jgi:hypothetical protein
MKTEACHQERPKRALHATRYSRAKTVDDVTAATRLAGRPTRLPPGAWLAFVFEDLTI